MAKKHRFFTIGILAIIFCLAAVTSQQTRRNITDYPHILDDLLLQVDPITFKLPNTHDWMFYLSLFDIL